RYWTWYVLPSDIRIFATRAAFHADAECEFEFNFAAEKTSTCNVTLSGSMKGGSQREDTVVREIEVVPNGESKEIVFSGRLDSSARNTVRFPETSVPDASKIFVRLYSGPLSQVIEGMDSIVRMPFGCFEQTSSATY